MSADGPSGRRLKAPPDEGGDGSKAILPDVTGSHELYVESLDMDRFGNVFTTIKGLLVFNDGDFGSMRTVSDLRKRIDEELGEEFDYAYLFVKGTSVLTPQQERRASPMTVIHAEKIHRLEQVYTEYKVTVRRVMTEVSSENAGRSSIERRAEHQMQMHAQMPSSPPSPVPASLPPGSQSGGSVVGSVRGMVSFDAHGADGASSIGGRTQSQQNLVGRITKQLGVDDRRLSAATSVSSQGGSKIRDSTFMMKLDIFAGHYERFFITLDSTYLLSAYGPCSASDTLESLKRKVHMLKPSETINMVDVYRLNPYSGNIPRPPQHFTLEMTSNSGTKWVLALPTVAAFAKWVKRFHRAAPALGGMQYNIDATLFEWTIEAKDRDRSDAGSVKSESSVSRALGKTLKRGTKSAEEVDPSQQDGREGLRGSGGSWNKYDNITTMADGSTVLKRNGSSNNEQGVSIKNFLEVSFESKQLGLQLTTTSDGTSVFAVMKDGPAAAKGVREADCVIAVNDRNVVGKPWRDVKTEILEAKLPVRITFGRPDKNRRKKKLVAATSSAAAQSVTGFHFRQRLGPYVYHGRNVINSLRGKIATNSTAVAPPRGNDQFAAGDGTSNGNAGPWTQGASQFGKRTSYGVGGSRPSRASKKKSAPALPPRIRRVGSKIATLLRTGKRQRNNKPTYGEDDQSNARNAASMQLNRYRDVQSRLYQAIEESVEREEQVERMLKQLVADAARARERDQAKERKALLAAETKSSSFRASKLPAGAGPHKSLVAAVRMQDQPANPENRTRSIRDEAAMSSRVAAQQLTLARATRLRAMQEAVHMMSARARREHLCPCYVACWPLRWGWRAPRLGTLIKIASEGDIDEREDALDALLDLVSEGEQPMSDFIKAGLMPVLKEALESDESPVLRENAAGIIWNLSDDTEVTEQIVHSGVVPLLLDILDLDADDMLSSDVAKEEAAGALWNLADSAACKHEVLKRQGGIETILRVLDRDNSDEFSEFAQENAAGALWNLAFDPDCVDEIMHAPKPQSNKEKHAASKLKKNGTNDSTDSKTSKSSRSSRQSARSSRSSFVSESTEDASMTGAHVIRALARLILKGTVVAQENAAGALMCITYSPAYRNRIHACKDAIPALVQLLAFGSMLSRENASGALHHVAIDNDKIQRLIADEGAVPPLMRMMQPQFSVSARTRAALCLRTLSQNAENKEEITAIEGGVESLVKALKEEDAFLQVIVVEALWGLAHENEDNKVYIAQAGAIPQLVNILRNGDDTARTRAAGALGSLADNDRNAAKIVKSGALKPLVKMVQPRHASSRASRLEAAAALGTLSIRADGKNDRAVLKSLNRALELPESGDLTSARERLLRLEEQLSEQEQVLDREI